MIYKPAFRHRRHRLLVGFGLVLAISLSAISVSADSTSEQCFFTLRSTCTEDPSQSCTHDSACTNVEGDTCNTEVLTQTNPDCQSSSGSDTAQIAQRHKLHATCPAPTVKQGSWCVLTRDITIDSTLALEAFTHLNCRGHKILPASTTSTGIVRSTPEVALFLNGAYGSTIRNCVIGDAANPFDVGIVLVKSKTPADVAGDPRAIRRLRNQVLHNRIRTRGAGLYIFYADNNLVRGNTFESIGGCSIGIGVQYDSDRNVITENTVMGSEGTSGGPIRYPGTDDQIFPCLSDGIFVSGAIGPFPLVNVRVGNELIQLRNVPEIGTTGLSELSSDGNVIERNSCTQVGPSEGKDHVNILFPHDITDTLVQNNTVSGGFNGMMGSGGVFTSMIPGTCTLDSSRYCLADVHCFISGVDTTSKGICTGVTTQTFRRIGRGSSVAHNQLTGSFNNFGISMGHQVDATFIGHTIQATAPFGINIQNAFLETGIVKNNIVDGPTNALRLQVGNAGATFFGATVSQNDFIGYTTAVRVANNYNFPSELSALGRGNYWGLSYDQSGGFDPDLVKRANDQMVNFVQDSHPYGVSVAGLADDLLPTTLADGYCSATP